jgi:DHA2 family multidrug resistance protein
MQVLDTSIANVAIPAISGDRVYRLQGTGNYLVRGKKPAIAVPLTGWLARRFGGALVSSRSCCLRWRRGRAAYPRVSGC